MQPSDYHKPPSPKLPAPRINSLPDDVRNYIMWLETDADPAGTLAWNWHLVQENRALRVLLEQQSLLILNRS